MAWLQRRAGVLPGSEISRGGPLSGPSHRQEPVEESPDGTVRLDPRRDARLFTGSVFAAERSQMFTGPGGDVQAEPDLDA